MLGTGFAVELAEPGILGVPVAMGMPVNGIVPWLVGGT